MSSTTDSETDRCLQCNRSLKHLTGQIKIIGTTSEVEAIREQLVKTVEIGDKLCDKCRRLVFFGTSKRNVEQEKPVDNPEMDTSESPSHFSTDTPSEFSQPSSNERFEFTSQANEEEIETVEVPLNRTLSSHKYCCLCKAEVGLVVVPLEARLQCFQKLKIFIPRGNRTCLKHLVKKRFYDDELHLIEVYSNSSLMSGPDISLFLTGTSNLSTQTFLDKVKSFQLSDDQIKTFTGFSYDTLNELTELLTSVNASKNRDALQALVIFLFKLRTGQSNKLISSVFEIRNEQQVSQFCDSILNSFEKDILPVKFGVNSVSREDLIANHTSAYVKKLFNYSDVLVLTFDGTYIRHQKSQNNDYQRKAYSGHKKVPLCKPFTISTTDGFVVDVPGPFLATENDASIMKKVMDDPNGIRKIMKPGDVCIVDRGFRDVVSYLEDLGFIVLMPALKGNRPNLTAKESNYSRFVTKLRWVIEAVHGIIGKKFKLLHNQLDNKLLPKVGLYCKIACFLNNQFGKRLNSDGELQNEIAERMIHCNLDENTLASEAETARWSRRSTLTTPLNSEDVWDFPEMTEKDLKIFFAGTYQMGQAISYLAEMLDDSGNLNMHCVKLRENILKVQIRSRHINKKTYKCYVEYKPNSIGYGGILRHCCDCANGLRTVGCCSHVAAIIYYLANGRYRSKMIKPAKILSQIFNYDGIEPVINEDSDED